MSDHSFLKCNFVLIWVMEGEFFFLQNLNKIETKTFFKTMTKSQKKHKTLTRKQLKVKFF